MPPIGTNQNVEFESQWKTNLWTGSYDMDNMRRKFSLFYEWVELLSLGTQLFITDFSRRNLIFQLFALTIYRISAFLINLRLV